MTEVTIQLPEHLAEQLQPMRPWLPLVLELSLLNLHTPAYETANEIIQFLSTNPPPAAVAAYQVSSAVQERVQRLLTLQQAGLLTEVERLELDERERLEHVLRMWKLRLLTPPITH